MMDEDVKTFFSALQKNFPKGILLVGMGNCLKADDGVGAALCSQLKKSMPNHVIEAGMVPENYFQVIIDKNPDVIIFIDAIDFGASPGTIKIVDPGQLAAGGLSTHTVSPRFLSGIITQRIPAQIYFVGIQPKIIRIGSLMSPEVESAKKELVELLLQLFSSKET